MIDRTNLQLRRSRAYDRLAQTRAEIERPMTAAMAAEAASFGPRRQLTLTRYRRILTILLFGTIAAQVLLVVLFGPVSSIIIGSCALAIGAAATAYHSAEVTLKVQSDLAKSWRTVTLLAALAGPLFLLKDSGRVWLIRFSLADVISILFGGLMVSTFHALTSRLPTVTN